MDSNAINYLPIVGTFFGEYTYTMKDTTFTESTSANIEIQTSTTVNITLFTNMQTYFIANAEVKNNANGLYTLTAPSLNGNVNGKLISFYYMRGNFVGSKP